MFIGVDKTTAQRLNELISVLDREKDELLRIIVAQSIVLSFLKNNN